MPETPNGLRFPTLGDTPDAPRDFQALAEDADEHITRLDNQFNGAGMTVRAGSTVDTADGTGRATVGYNFTFTAPPLLVVCLGDDSATGQTVRALEAETGTTQASVLIRDASGNPVGGGAYRINWVAVGAA